MREQETQYQWRMDMGAWVAVALVIMVGVVASIAILVAVMVRPQHTIEGLVVPGEHQLNLPNAGYHVIYLAFQRTEDRRGVIRPEGHERLAFTLIAQNGREIPLTPVPEEHDYVSRYTRGKSAFAFTLDTPGAYNMTAAYPENLPAGDALEVVVRQVHRNNIRDAFLGAVAGLLVTALLTTAVCAVGLRRFQQSNPSSRRTLEANTGTDGV